MNALSGSAVRLLGRLPTVLWLTAMWAVLWGDTSPGTLIAGFAVGAGCYAAAKLPHLPVRLRFRPLWAALLAGRILLDLFTSSVQMGYYALDRPGRVRGAIVAVPLRTDSDLLMAMVSGGLSLVTGSQTIELDREGGVIYVHGVPIRGEGDVPRLRRDVRRMEELFVRAFGSAADIADFEATERAMNAAGAAGKGER
ncbi:Na+/H+ antiporter subunit E [Nocardiopsis suaedae]|uniref:Na+/H+ antiporter subunit E n=1 Tax=Nocardiopsis suaedae TaxID=3018444 RepID=A0ABT4TSX0_9ACTN|nr:Na+/H+ antiporter subunit E [Nocardiopsis suaedae]MDA2807335.1 Na+/H+ antiporter subunit E [Nocardiopsis suaedae]